MAYSSSRTWRSKGLQASGEFRNVAAALTRMRLDRSPFVPHSTQEFMRHKMEVAISEAADRRKKIEQVTYDIDLAKEQDRDPVQVKLFMIHEERWPELYERAITLASNSIWSPLWRPTADHPQSPWPATDEFREEGDERHTSGFYRFLPIPRVPGNPSVVWKQKSFQSQKEIDQVHPVARKYNIELPGDYERMEPIYDDDGNVIDDSTESGNTIYTNELAKEIRGFQVNKLQKLEYPVLPVAPSFIPPKTTTTNKKVHKHAIAIRNANEAEFSFNPDVPEFVSTTVQQDNSESPGSSDASNDLLGTNPYAALSNLRDSPQKSESSKTLVKMVPSVMDLYLPDFLDEDDPVQEVIPQEHEETHIFDAKQAEKTIFESYNLPSLKSLEINHFAPRISAAMRAAKERAAAGRAQGFAAAQVRSAENVQETVHHEGNISDSLAAARANHDSNHQMSQYQDIASPPTQAIPPRGARGHHRNGSQLDRLLAKVNRHTPSDTSPEAVGHGHLSESPSSLIDQNSQYQQRSSRIFSRSDFNDRAIWSPPPSLSLTKNRDVAQHTAEVDSSEYLSNTGHLQETSESPSFKNRGRQLYSIQFSQSPPLASNIIASSTSPRQDHRNSQNPNFATRYASQYNSTVAPTRNHQVNIRHRSASLLARESDPLRQSGGNILPPIGTRSQQASIGTHPEWKPQSRTSPDAIVLGSQADHRPSQSVARDIFRMNGVPLDDAASLGGRYNHGTFPLMEQNAEDDDNDCEIISETASRKRNSGLQSPPETPENHKNLKSQSPESNLAFRLGTIGL